MKRACLSKGLGLPVSILLTVLMMACDFSTAHITTATLGTGYAGGKVVGQTTTFQPSDREIHLVVEVANAPDGTKVTCAWWAVNAGGVTDNKVASLDLTLNSGQGIADCKFSNTSDWPSGTYKVDLSLNDKLDRTVPFSVA